MPRFAKRYPEPGTPPGTINAEPSDLIPEISVIDYSKATIDERTIENPADCGQLHDEDFTTWIHVQGPVSTELLGAFNEDLGFHNLALEDIANIGQRPKLDEFEDHLFVILNLPSMRKGVELRTHQVSIFASQGYVISFCAERNDLFDPIRKRLQNPASRLRSNGGSSYLFHAILDVVVDHGFPLLEELQKEIETVEEDVLANRSEDVLKRLHRIRRNLLVMHKSLWPQREVLSRLTEIQFGQGTENIRPYLRDCYDHNVQMMDLVETYRDIVASIFEIHISNNSNRLNETMRFLTVIATIFIPLTFIVGIYGMNFASESTSVWAMPELRWSYGYPFVWLCMIATTGGMVWFFRRRNWL